MAGSGRLDAAMSALTLDYSAAGVEVREDLRAAHAMLLPLLDPIPGAPSGHRPQGLTEGVAWVPMLAPEDASGPDADLYGGSSFVPHIVRALSLVPDHVRTLRSWSAAHYVALTDLTARRAIDRPQIELVAARVSALNQCFY